MTGAHGVLGSGLVTVAEDLHPSTEYPGATIGSNAARHLISDAKPRYQRETVLLSGIVAAHGPAESDAGAGYGRVRTTASVTRRQT